MNLRDFVTIGDRRTAISRHVGKELSHIGTYSTELEQASLKNCENMIGCVQVPLGIAGPLRIQNTKIHKQDYYIPLATTEGALVASVNRGCKAVTDSGGVKVVSNRIGTTRAPVFEVKGIEEAKIFIEWIAKHFNTLRTITEQTSSHLKLCSIEPSTSGRSVFLRFTFDTQDAMGMNMATIAVTKASEYITSQTEAKLIAVTGNLCVDKKPSYVNFLGGRGWQVWAEAIIPQHIIELVLKTNIRQIVSVFEHKIHLGSIMSGTIGANAHMANILAAIFLATGQDIAHVAECGTGITTVEEVNGSLYTAIYLPDLVIGTIGGGTNLPTQKESLEILDIKGGENGKNAQKFAEIIAAAILSGEVSLLASLAENSLAKAHEKLGRGKK